MDQVEDYLNPVIGHFLVPVEQPLLSSFSTPEALSSPLDFARIKIDNF